MDASPLRRVLTRDFGLYGTGTAGRSLAPTAHRKARVGGLGVSAMRVMARIHIDTEAGNAANRNGTLQKTMQAFLERVRPEAAYFSPSHGKRSAYVVFELDDPSEIPPCFEPLFQELKAEVDIRPVMTADDLRAGLERLHQA